MDDLNENLGSFNNKGPYSVDPADLPLSCPMPSMVLWNAHPQVYLPLADTGEARCPYCGAQYILKKV